MRARNMILRSLSIAALAGGAASLAPPAEGAPGTTTASPTTASTSTSTSTSKTSALQQAAKNVYQPAWKSPPTTALAFDCVALPLGITNKSIVAGAAAVPTGGAVLRLSSTGGDVYSDASCSVPAATFTMTTASATVYLRAPTTPGNVTVTAAGDGTTVLSASTTLGIARPGKARLAITGLTATGMQRTAAYGGDPAPGKCGLRLKFVTSVVNVGSVASPAGGAYVTVGCPGYSTSDATMCRCGWAGAPTLLGSAPVPAGAPDTNTNLTIETTVSCNVDSAGYIPPEPLTGNEVVTWTQCAPGVECVGSGSLNLAGLCAQAKSSGIIDATCKWQ